MAEAERAVASKKQAKQRKLMHDLEDDSVVASNALMCSKHYLKSPLSMMMILQRVYIILFRPRLVEDALLLTHSTIRTQVCEE
jgi:hypothetical protein